MVIFRALRQIKLVIRFWIASFFVLSGKSYVLLHVYATYLRQE